MRLASVSLPLFVGFVGLEVGLGLAHQSVSVRFMAAIPWISRVRAMARVLSPRLERKAAEYAIIGVMIP
jgi:hypothetical protein